MQHSQAAFEPWFADSLPEPVPPANQCYPAFGVSEGPSYRDHVRAVSDLPLCLQPVYAGSFRSVHNVTVEHGTNINQCWLCWFAALRRLVFW